MLLKKDQDPKKLIEELEDEGFAYGDVARGELNDVQIQDGVVLFYFSCLGALTFIEKGDSGELPKKVDFKISTSSLSDGWYEITEVMITTTDDRIIIKKTENTEFVSAMPCP